MQQAIFCIGDEEYGLDIMDVNTVEKYVAVEQVANASNYIKGILDLRGDIIPVYSFRKRFGLEDIEPNEDTRLIITTSNGILMGYEVDKMLEIAQIAPDQINEVPSIIVSKDTSYIKSVSNLNGRLILLLNNDGILSEEEQSSIKTILAKKEEIKAKEKTKK